jgi:uncharacterized membrane protein HdeD (DUF308 family)
LFSLPITYVSQEDVQGIRRRWFSFALLGGVLSLAGLATLPSPWMLATLSVACFLAARGVCYFVGAFCARGWGGLLVGLVAGVPYLAVAVFLSNDLYEAFYTYQHLMAAFIVADGLFRVAAATFGRLRNGVWVFLSGVFTLLAGLGVLIWTRWHFQGWTARVIQLYLGLDIIVNGVTYLALGLSHAPPRLVEERVVARTISRLRTWGTANAFVGMAVALEVSALLLFTAGLTLSMNPTLGTRVWPTVLVLLLFGPILSLAIGMVISGRWLWTGVSSKWRPALVLQGIVAVVCLGLAIYMGMIYYENFVREQPAIPPGYTNFRQNQAVLYLWVAGLPSGVCLIVSSVTCFYLTRALTQSAGNTADNATTNGREGEPCSG